jgi:predicted MFS family arabinose efflux permease
VGLLISLAGAGMALGCYATGRLLHGVRRDRVVLGGALVAVVALTPIGASPSLVAAGLAAAVAGFAAGPVLVASETAIQEEALAERRATVFAVRDTLMKLGSALAAVAGPAAGALVGLGPAMVVLLATLAAATGLLAWWARPKA